MEDIDVTIEKLRSCIKRSQYVVESLRTQLEQSQSEIKKTIDEQGHQFKFVEILKERQVVIEE